MVQKLTVQSTSSPMQGTISNLFEGKMESYIKCSHVDYVSSRVETFFDIQLNIKDKKDGKVCLQLATN